MAVNVAGSDLFTAGDMIQEFEEPLVKSLHVSEKETHCSNCWKFSINLKRCSRCKIVLYCNKECQRLNWMAVHSVECKSKLFANPQTIPKVDPNTIHSLIRLMAFLNLHSDQAKKTCRLYDGSQRCFNNLIDHHEEIENDPKLKLAVQLMAAKLKEVDNQLFSSEELQYENILHLFGVWRTNSFGLSNEDDTRIIGSALYIASSSFDHSCRPNAIKVFDNMHRIAIRCIEPIPCGTSPKISYLAGIREKADRQRILKERYNFSCECSLCEAEMEGPLCSYDILKYVKHALETDVQYDDDSIRATYKLIDMMEKIFYRYDERITNLCYRILEELVAILEGPSPMLVTLSELKNFADDVEKRLRITFGIKQQDYQLFITELKPRLEAAYRLRNRARETSV